MDKPLGVICALAIAPVLHWFAIGAAHAAESAHAHGVVRLNVAIEAPAVTLQFDAPLDSLVGFEHAPRTAAQKQAVQAMLDRFKTPQSLFGFPAAAQCVLESSSAESEALEATKPASGGEHADLDGNFVFQCKQAAAVDSIDVAGLLAAFPRIARIDAVIVAQGGQFKRVLKRPEKILRWRR